MAAANSATGWDAIGNIDDRCDAIMRGLNTVLRSRGPARRRTFADPFIRALHP
jgi:hypothetical protein